MQWWGNVAVWVGPFCQQPSCVIGWWSWLRLAALCFLGQDEGADDGDVFINTVGPWCVAHVWHANFQESTLEAPSDFVCMGVSSNSPVSRASAGIQGI